MLTLHPQLQADCYEPGTINSSLLLLHKNALVPWFILVPNTHENELFKLEPAHQQLKAEKLNIATIGNIVPQLHIHIIGRHSDDFCWPAPVWGQSEFAHYTPQKLQRIKADLIRENIIDTAHS